MAGTATSQCYKRSVTDKDCRFCPVEWLVLAADGCAKHKEERHYHAASRNTFKLPFLVVVGVQAGEKRAPAQPLPSG